mmetsp:Transcript_82675/g.188955  ORF Transcript_82675/g.188955 Transcript_82675/m.188955 type:complete len:261 (-) Transcript_82675:1232-2014(-)
MAPTESIPLHIAAVASSIRLMPALCPFNSSSILKTTSRPTPPCLAFSVSSPNFWLSMHCCKISRSRDVLTWNSRATSNSSSSTEVSLLVSPFASLSSFLNSGRIDTSIFISGAMFRLRSEASCSEPSILTTISCTSTSWDRSSSSDAPVDSRSMLRSSASATPSPVRVISGSAMMGRGSKFCMELYMYRDDLLWCAVLWRGGLAAAVVGSERNRTMIDMSSTLASMVRNTFSITSRFLSNASISSWYPIPCSANRSFILS